METDTQVPMLHVRVDGRSHDVPLAELDVGDLSDDGEIRDAVAEHFEGVPRAKLDDFQVRRNEETGDITVHPQPVFG